MISVPEVPGIPAAFKAYDKFIIYKLIPKANGRSDKIPLHPHTLQPHDPHDPAVWLPADEALQYAAAAGYGVGFVFTKDDPFFFFDLDECLQADGTWDKFSTDMCGYFTGCYVEVSVSGRGLHIFGSGTYKPHGCSYTPPGIDTQFYTSGRFVALTGTGAVGCASHVPQAAIDWLIDSYFPEPVYADPGAEWTDSPCDESDPIQDDDKLIERMLQSKSAGSALGGKASVQDLWAANEDALAEVFPSQNYITAFDHSSADASLCQHLAFWTGKDCERVDRLFRRSGLVRDKWLDREDYRVATVMHAVRHCVNAYGADRKKDQEKAATLAVDYGAEYREGFQLMTLSRQLELFKGCVYIRDLHRVFVPDGSLLRHEQFKATYGGHLFSMDSINDKTSKNAWECFTESQGISFPKAHGVCFRPEEPQGAIMEEEDRKLVNVYVPANVVMEPGDVSRFTNHLKALLPDIRDQIIILSYMAAFVQYPGVKFCWTPLLQGCEGNGKSLFIKILSYAVGHRYTHLPNAADLAGNGSTFNAWMQFKLFIGVEEIRVAHKKEAQDSLKRLITEDRIEIQGKGADQVMGDNRANFFMNSNFKDAVFKHRGDRRYSVFFTVQQEPEDLIAAGWLTRDGRLTEYFPRLYEWLKNEGGYSHVAHFLANYKIPDEFNPATLCQRAPMTSSTFEAIDLSLGGIEQEIREAAEEGRPGFAKGWISSMALDRMLKDRRDDKKVPASKRGDLLKSLGYVQHPGLTDGRLNNPVPIDNGKPRLYITKDHYSLNLNKPADISTAYVDDQTGRD
jgi:hypothetical protein